jgi:hypothetical protein
MKEKQSVTKVRKFILDNESDVAEYEYILNNPKCSIFRDVVTYDKAGRCLITIWYTEEVEE